MFGKDGGPIQVEDGQDWFQHCTQEERMTILEIAEGAMRRASGEGKEDTMDTMM